MNPTESQIQASILDYLNMTGHYCWRNNTGSMMIQDRYFRAGLKGSSDILGIAKDGRMIAIEVKRPGKKPTIEQEEFIHQVASRGGHATVASSLEQIQEFMQIEIPES